METKNKYTDYMAYFKARKEYQKKYCQEHNLLPNLDDIISRLSKSEINFVIDILNLRVIDSEARLMLKFKEIELFKKFGDSWKQYAKDDFQKWSEYALQEVILPLAIKLYKRYFSDDDISLEDLINEGFIGVSKAWNNFTPILEGKTAMFSTYMVCYVKSAMYTYLSGSSDAKTKQNRLKVAYCINDYYNEFHTFPSIEEIAKKTGFTLKMISNIISTLKMFDITKSGKIKTQNMPENSMEKNIHTTDDSKKRTMIMIINELIPSLAPLEAYVIRQHYYNQKTIESIAKELCLSKTTVIAIKKDAIELLKRKVSKI